ncbi:MAG TPA: class I SAM-dependent methyltransferase [Candidatus Paceibacterota bacterium]|jgi:hypothetical protein
MSNLAPGIVVPAPSRYSDLAARAVESLPQFRQIVGNVSYEAKGILDSEMFFLRLCLKDGFDGRILESGRARGQSTLVLALLFPRARIISIELDPRSPDVSVAQERLSGHKNVDLRFGNAEEILPTEIAPGDVVLIDGPKMFRAVRLAIRLLASGRPDAVFMHDMKVGTPERVFLTRFFPEALFSDARTLAKVTHELDKNALTERAPLTRLEEVTGDFGYGYSLTCLPRVPRKSYRLLLLLSYVYDALCRLRTRVRI